MKEQKIIVYPENSKGKRIVVFQNGPKVTAITAVGFNYATLVSLSDTLNYRTEAAREEKDG